MADENKTKVVGIRIKPDLLKEIDEVAKKDWSNRNQFLIDAAKEKLRKEKKKFKI
jgi:metal-responsive CopG/Arc/MetJ family transcriptional regulator